MQEVVIEEDIEQRALANIEDAQGKTDEWEKMMEEQGNFMDIYMQQDMPKSKQPKNKVKSQINLPLFNKKKITSLLKKNIHLKRVNLKLKEQIRVMKNKLERHRKQTGLETLIRFSFPSNPFPKKPKPQKLQKKLCPKCGKLFGQARYERDEIQLDKFVSVRTQTEVEHPLLHRK